MKLIVDIPDDIYDDIKHGYICSEYADKLIQLIPNSKPYEEQPQGEWIVDNWGMYHCNYCMKEKQQLFHNFCSNCGADMRGGAE